ncbi:hypothetical protein ACFSTH_05905 [Paenibacillus yanchengensis]|uniref:hypothetical protein n=1 Tax=Paenibacillus yanchengensis TaxID=2035833 RepID=UPI00363E6E66
MQQTDFVNYDELAELARRVTRFTGPDYSDEQLNNMRKEDWRKDLEEVTRNFANEKLLIDVAFMFSLPDTYNPRSIVVGSTTGTIYLINLVKRHNYDGIWTATNYGIVSESNIGTESQNIAYNIITLDNAAPKVKEWAQAYLNSTHGAEEVFISGNANMDEDKTYILLVAEPKASIELLNIRAANQMVVVNYADSFLDEEMYGRQPYVLLEFEAPVLDVFIKKNSSVRIKDIRPYM